MPYPANDINRINAALNEGKAIAGDIRSLKARIDAFIPLNQALGCDWGAGSKPAVLVEDANSNLQGYTFSRQDFANLIGSLVQIQNLLTNVAPTQGDHIGNVNMVADVPVRYPI